MSLLTKAVEKLDNMREEYLTMQANFKHLEVAFDKFTVATENKVDKLFNENENLRRRVTELEGLMNSILKVATKEAMESAIRAHLKETGKIPEGFSVTNQTLLGSTSDSKDSEV